MVNKDSYNCYEMISATRDYLREGYAILNKMLSLIDINSDVPYEASIKIAQEMVSNIFTSHIIYKDEPYNGRILLFISKKGFNPMRMIRNYQTRYNEDEDPRYSIDHVDLTIEKIDGDFVFKDRYDHNIKRKYQPKLNILDKDKFNVLYQRLVDEGYLTYPHLLYFNKKDLDNHFSFALGSQDVGMELSKTLKECMRFEYFPEDDSFIIQDTRKKPNLSIKELLEYPIDKIEIYKGYQDIIERNLNNGKYLSPVEEMRIKVLSKKI